MGNPIFELFKPESGVQDRWFWATVEQSSPLRVREDGAHNAINTTPKTLTAVGVGDRVLCLRTGRRLLVVGRMGGTPPPVIPAAGTVLINNRLYQSSGRVSAPAWTLSRSDGGFLYTGYMDVSVPYTPPSGWTFVWSLSQTNGFTFLTTAQSTPVNGKQRLYVTQVGNNSTSVVTYLAWQLVKI